MNHESRKASRDSFALQQARLHFSIRPLPIRTSLPEGVARVIPSTRRDIVRKGLIGFVPKGVQ